MKKLLFGLELIDTRHVNLCFDELIFEMSEDFGLNIDNLHNENNIFEHSKQLIIFTISNQYYFTELKFIHEIINIKKRDKYIFKFNENELFYGILNWYEGLVPLVKTDVLINNKQDNFSHCVIIDVKKEKYGFIIDKIIQKIEIRENDMKEKISIGNITVKYINFEIYYEKLYKERLNLFNFLK